MIPFLKRHEHTPEEELSAYLDGELSSRESARVDAHLARCEACSTSIEGLRSVAAMLGALPSETPSRSFALSPAQAGLGGQRRPPARRFSVPAFAPALAMTIFVALIAVDFLPSSHSSDDEATSGASAFSASREAATKDSAGAGSLADSVAPSPAVPPAGAPAPSVPGQAPSPALAPARSLAPEAPSTGGATAAPPAEPTSATLQRFAPQPTPATGIEATDATTDSDADSGASISLLRWLQIGTAVAFVVSLVAVIVTRSPGRRPIS